MLSSQTQAATAPTQTYWENTAETRWGSYLTQLECQALLDALAAFPQQGQGLEIGCEGGRWTRMLTERGWQMTATDVDPKSLALCQHRNPSVRCVLVQPQDQELPAESASIDLLLCLEVAEVAGRPWFYSESSRVLRPGGKLVGTLNNLLSWRGAAVSLKSKLLRRRRFYSVTFPEFQRSLLEHGLTIEKANGCCWAPFGRHSDSRFVPAATILERSLRLHRLPSLSPWVLYTATRQ